MRPQFGFTCYEPVVVGIGPQLDKVPFRRVYRGPCFRNLDGGHGDCRTENPVREQFELGNRLGHLACLQLTDCRGFPPAHNLGPVNGFVISGRAAADGPPVNRNTSGGDEQPQPAPRNRVRRGSHHRPKVTGCTDWDHLRQSAESERGGGAAGGHGVPEFGFVTVVNAVHVPVKFELVPVGAIHGGAGFGQRDLRDRGTFGGVGNEPDPCNRLIRRVNEQLPRRRCAGVGDRYGGTRRAGTEEKSRGKKCGQPSHTRPPMRPTVGIQTNR